MFVTAKSVTLKMWGMLIMKYFKWDQMIVTLNFELIGDLNMLLCLN